MQFSDCFEAVVYWDCDALQGSLIPPSSNGWSATNVILMQHYCVFQLNTFGEAHPQAAAMGDDSEWMKLPIDQKCEHKVTDSPTVCPQWYSLHSTSIPFTLFSDFPLSLYIDRRCLSSLNHIFWLTSWYLLWLILTQTILYWNCIHLSGCPQFPSDNISYILAWPIYFDYYPLKS